MKAVLTANTENFSELVEIANLHPAKSFRYTNLRQVDFSGSNLKGFDFTGSRIDGAIFDGAILGDAKFDVEQLGKVELKSARDFAAFVQANQERLLSSREKELRSMLSSLIAEGLEASNFERNIRQWLPTEPKGKTIVVAVGDQAAAFGKAIQNNWEGEIGGVIYSRYGSGELVPGFEKLEAAHPIPDESCVFAANRILDMVGSLTTDDLLIVALSSKASGLLSAPSGQVSLTDLQAVSRQLLASGAPLSELWTVRKHITKLGGGKLAQAAYPARVATLISTDSDGLPEHEFANAPTTGLDSRPSDALAVLRSWEVQIPESVEGVLSTNPERPTSKTGRNDLTVVASPALIREQLSVVVGAYDFDFADMGSLEGEVKDVAATIVFDCMTHANHAEAKPLLLAYSGEYTVSIENASAFSKGGPNSELMLHLAMELRGDARVTAVSIATDGMDGNSYAAGAFVGPNTLSRSMAGGLNVEHLLETHNSSRLFEELGDTVSIGSTHMNIGDLTLVAVQPARSTD